MTSRPFALAAALAFVAMPAAADYIYRVPIWPGAGADAQGSGSPVGNPGVEVQAGSTAGSCEKTKDELDTIAWADVAFKYFLSEEWSWICKDGIYVTTTKPMLLHVDETYVSALSSRTVQPEGGFFFASVLNPDSQILSTGMVRSSLCEILPEDCGVDTMSGSHLSRQLHGLYDPRVSTAMELWSVGVNEADPLLIPAVPASFSMHETPDFTLDWPAQTALVGEEIELLGGVDVRQTTSEETVFVERTFDNGATFEEAGGSVRVESGVYHYTPSLSDKGGKLRMNVSIIDKYNMPFNDMLTPLSEHVAEAFTVQDELMYVGLSYSEGGSLSYPIVRGGSGAFSVTPSNPPSIPGITIEDGYLNGTPTTAGVYNIAFTAEDLVTGETVSDTLALEIEELTPLVFVASIPDGAIRLNTSNNWPRSISFDSGAQGGMGALSYSLSGSLPDGLSFNAATGEFSGAITQTAFDAYPSQAAPYIMNVTVTAEDEMGTTASKGVSFSVCRGTGTSGCLFQNGDMLEENDPTGEGPVIGTTATGNFTPDLSGAGLTTPFNAVSAFVNASSCNRSTSWSGNINFCTGWEYDSELSFDPSTGEVSYEASQYMSSRTDYIEMLFEGANGKMARAFFNVEVPRNEW